MLVELYIRNFAIIEELRIQLDGRLNVLTGETGAGKSIILDAMALVLGDRADTTFIRQGTDRAYVEAAFKLEHDLLAEFSTILEREGLEGDQSDILLLSRELRLNGRNISRINGRAVNLSILRDFGKQLVDIHGQGEHLSLLNPRSHLRLLDAYAGLDSERALVAQSVATLRQVRQQLKELKQDKRVIVQRIDYLQYLVDEIESANLADEEDKILLAERTRLANMEQLKQLCQAVISNLGGFEDDSPSVSDLLGQAEKAIINLASLDKELEPAFERLQGLNYQINDLSAEIMDYQEKLDHDPQRLTFVEERIELINSLKRKYGSTIADILETKENAVIELETITQSEKQIQALGEQELQLLHEIGELGLALSEKRHFASLGLSSEVERELKELNMERASFRVSLIQNNDEFGAFVNNKRISFAATGIDQVEFLISTNPGESPRPLAKVASGGETSRLMLALKSVLAKVDQTPTLIFDEIDQGIGGRVGDVVGRKLWGLTTPSRHQVIVVTHLPQLAGYADGHYHVSKSLKGDRTTTSVSRLDSNERIQELAAMLGTQDDYATGGAKSILQQAALAKRTN
jgi:DNA repair protein RecN (Recombination protein N)